MKQKQYIISLVVFLLPFVLFAQNDQDEIIAGKDIGVIEIESGKIRGYIHNGTYVYKGIPYASAGRFMPPEKPKTWTDVKFMAHWGPVCPLDFEPIAARGNGVGSFALQNDWGYPSENCQSLNIWTQAINDNKRRPVMIWIHGGGFEYGSSHELPFYDGESLSKGGDVVLVSVNHRLNILGFLDLSQYGEKYKYSPNVGLLDLVAALKWVKNNIAQFGGDPDNVTLFGQSGGGGKITALLNSPIAKGLFHKAVIQSGSYATTYLDTKVAQKISAKILENLSLSSSQVDHLQTIPYHTLLSEGKKAVASVRKEMQEKGEKMNASIWGPVHDSYFLPYNIFTPEALELSKNVPLMIGTTKNEFSLGGYMQTGGDEDTAMKLLEERYKDKKGSYINALLKAYPNTVKPSDYLDVDFLFRVGAIRDANKLARAGHNNIFMYLFAWESPVNDGFLKSMHCMELPFVFDNIQKGKELTGGGKAAYVLAKKVSAAWINFAKTGNPHAEGLPLWPKYSIGKGATMIFDNKSEIKYHHDKDLLEIAVPELKY